jgi:hypothetical protein
VSAFDELVTRMAPACGQAVDPREIAAVLEADGITDAIARSRYASPDVFDLAERLCTTTPSKPTATAWIPSPWRATPLKHVLRGVLFGLPALAYLIVADQITGVRSAALLVFSVLLSWATGQALAYLGHVRLGWGDPADAASVLYGGLLWIGIPSIAATAGLGFVSFELPIPVTLVATGQVAYVLAATVALVLGREWWLLAALAPGVGAAIVGLVLGDALLQSAPFAWCAGGSVIASIVVAMIAVRGHQPRPPSLRELSAATPNALFGITVGALLIFVPAVQTFDPAPDAVIAKGAALAALLPLSVSMGAAEWLLYRYRSATHRALQESRSLADFGWGAAAALLGVTVGYLIALLTLSAAGVGLVIVLSGQSPGLRPLATAAVVGTALFVALLLMSFGVRLPVVAACLLALVADAALLRIATPEQIQAVTAAGLLLVLLTYALATLRRAQLHH